MASNPMQRKARISFLLGMFVTLLISGAIIVFLFIQLAQKNQEEKSEKAAEVQICVLNSDVKSGQIITEDLLEVKTVNKDLVPSNAAGKADTILHDCALRDKEGNNVSVKTEKDGNGEIVNKFKLRINGKDYDLNTTETGSYYYEINNERKYVELDAVPVVAKVDMNKNTVITSEMISKEDSQVTNDMRKQEYNMIVMPVDIETDDYVDVRLMLPTGEDYIVVSRKKVEIPEVAGIPSTDTVKMNLSEDETLSLSNAIVEAYQMIGSKLYLAKYTEPGSQKSAIPTYVPNGKVSALIDNNPNLVESAKQELAERYSDRNKSLRNNNINSAITSSGEEGQENLKAKMEESITNTKDSRKQYLDGTSGAVE